MSGWYHSMVGDSIVLTDNPPRNILRREIYMPEKDPMNKPMRTASSRKWRCFSLRNSPRSNRVLGDVLSNVTILPSRATPKRRLYARRKLIINDLIAPDSTNTLCSAYSNGDGSFGRRAFPFEREWWSSSSSSIVSNFFRSRPIFPKRLLMGTINESSIIWKGYAIKSIRTSKVHENVVLSFFCQCVPCVTSVRDATQTVKLYTLPGYFCLVSVCRFKFDSQSIIGLQNYRTTARYSQRKPDIFGINISGYIF